MEAMPQMETTEITLLQAMAPEGMPMEAESIVREISFPYPQQLKGIRLQEETDMAETLSLVMAETAEQVVQGPLAIGVLYSGGQNRAALEDPAQPE